MRALGPSRRCKEALAATGGSDYDAALGWLRAKETELGQAKAAKVEGRTAADGAVALFRVGPAHACIVEVGSVPPPAPPPAALPARAVDPRTHG